MLADFYIHWLSKDMNITVLNLFVLALLQNMRINHMLTSDNSSVIYFINNGLSIISNSAKMWGTHRIYYYGTTRSDIYKSNRGRRSSTSQWFEKIYRRDTESPNLPFPEDLNFLS